MVLEKTVDTIPTGMVVATVKWKRGSETGARMMETAINERRKGRVVVEIGMLDECHVNIGLKQGSTLNPLLFFLGTELISSEDQGEGCSYKDDVRRRSDTCSR